MAYTRPDFDAADASWQGHSAYTRPDFDAADATWQVAGDVEALIADTGLPLAPAAYVEVTNKAYIEDTGLPIAPSSVAISGAAAWVEVDSPLGAVEAVAIFSRAAWIQVDSPLGAVAALGYSDFTSLIRAGQATFYVMTLVTPEGEIEAPISSWQATLDTDQESYVGCVVPACGQWLDTIEEATEFYISRRVVINGATVSQEMARAPLQTLQVDRGPTNHTASISGYADAYAAGSEDQIVLYDRPLSGIRSISTYSSGARVRCEIDWLLRPGFRATYAETSMIVSYLNIYVTMNQTSLESYMDVGERIQ